MTITRLVRFEFGYDLFELLFICNWEQCFADCGIWIVQHLLSQTGKQAIFAAHALVFGDDLAFDTTFSTYFDVAQTMDE